MHEFFHARTTASNRQGRTDFEYHPHFEHIKIKTAVQAILVLTKGI